MHLMYDLTNKVPICYTFSKATCNDIEEGKKFEIEKGNTYIFDRGYMDFNWWSEIDEKGAYFVSRLKNNNAYNQLSEIQEHNEIVSSQIIQMRRKTSKDGHHNNYSDKPLRKVIVQREGKTPLELITNDFKRGSEEIADLYKSRWQIELFFKWIKQNLKIKKFLGRSENAVKTQICIALIAYLLIYEAKELKEIMSECCKYFSESKFVKMINNNVFKTLKPRIYNRTRDNPWQLKFQFAQI